MSRKCQRFVFSSAPRGPGEVQERGRKGRAALVVSSRAGGAHVRQLLLAADVDLEVSGALVDADDLVLVHLVARCGEIWGNAGRFGEMRGDLVLKHLVARRSEERTPLLRILQAVPRRRPLFVREQVAAIAPRECQGEVREVSRKCPECQLPRSRLSKSPAHGLYPAKVVVMTASPRVAYSLAISGPLGSSRGRAWCQPARRRHELGLDARHGARRDLISSSQPLAIGT